MANIIYSDLNVRLKDVQPLDIMTITNSKAVLQSLNRLLTVEEGSLPYYRSYGLNLKQFQHAPLSQQTAKNIVDYIENKVKIFETRITITNAYVDVNYDTGYFSITLTCSIKATGDVVITEPLLVNVGV